MPFVGVKTGRTLEWFVPTLFKGRWKAQGDRLLREIEDEYIDVRPVPLSQAIKKVSIEAAAGKDAPSPNGGGGRGGSREPDSGTHAAAASKEGQKKVTRGVRS